MENDREKIIRNYVVGYNQFDIDKMLMDFDDLVVFENIQDGEVNMSLKGLVALRQQAEEAKVYFVSRTQVILSFTHRADETEIEIDYHAVLNMDFPNGLKKGDELKLKGKSIFKFSHNTIIKLTDIA